MDPGKLKRLEAFLANRFNEAFYLDHVVPLRITQPAVREPLATNDTKTHPQNPPTQGDHS